MKMKSAHVRTFRNIVDSGEMDVHPDVTCLVGKNESGKTALLHALRALNYEDEDAELDQHADYPRWLLKEHELDGTLGDEPPVTATFELTDAEMEDLAARFGTGVVTSPEVVVTHDWDGRNRFKFRYDEPVFVAGFISGLDDDIAEPLKTAKTVVALRSGLDRMVSATTPDPDAGKPGNPAMVSRFEAAVHRLDELVGPAPKLAVSGLSAALTKAVRGNLPKFFYFGEYDFLPGRADKRRLVVALAADDLSSLDREEGEHTAAKFLRLARTTAGSLDDRDFETNTAELEAVANYLTRQVSEYWKQNEHLRLVVEIEDELGPHPQGGKQLVSEWIQFRVKDTRHEYTGNIDRRSQGYRWFVSFFASFAEFAKDSNVIVLLDEPGLHLHGRAQDDLLRLIDNRLADNHQVIYTTHSPWMVPVGHLDRVRLVEDNGPEHGSVVTDQALAHDPDTLFPLQAALGYDLAQHLFVGPNNLAVEGISDHIYMTVISDWLREQGRTALDPEWRVLPVGGIDNVPAFVALIGPHLEVTVLIDSASKPNQRIGNLISRGVLQAKRLVSIGQVLNANEGDIEDLFDPGEYLALYNRTFGKKVTAKALKGDDRIVARIARTDGDFDHGRVADMFLRHHTEIVPTLSVATLDRFEKLFDAINATRPT